MQKSDSIKELAAALSKAQGEIKGAKKDATNPHFKSKYADLASIVEAIQVPLSKHGIAYVQLTLPTEKDEVQVETVLMHSSGEWVSGTIALPVSKHDAQGFGSALTYARRYGLAAAVGVAPEDDDGQAATNAAPRRQEAPQAHAPAELLLRAKEAAKKGLPSYEAFWKAITANERTAIGPQAHADFKLMAEEIGTPA